MTLHARMATLTMGATALLGILGCDTGSAEPEGELEGELEFRCTQLGGCSGGGSGGTGGGLGNTSFLGLIVGADGQNQRVYPLNNLPLAGNTIDGVSLLQIRAPHCRDATGATLQGAFVTEADPDVGVSATGALLPKTFYDSFDSSVTCTVEDELWVDTTWEIEYGNTAVPFQTTLRINDITLEASTNGAPLYELQVDAGSVPDPRTGWTPICDYDWDTPGLEFHAYLMPGLTIDPVTGNFASDPDAMFVGCISGSIGKAWQWGYKSFIQAIGPEGHEVAHNVIRAEYCDDDVPYTLPGTHIWLQSIFTDEGPHPNAPVQSGWQLEAVWSSDPGDKAICVGTTRRPEQQPPGGAAFSCEDEVSLPICNEEHLLHEDAVMASWAWTGTGNPSP